MLQIQHIKKEYRTGKLVQKALDDVSLNLRDNEFVAILGPSGSGKTTLLNIIGGLDQYDSGDLVINGISTKKYKDRDWDSYRNHTIGFVFQSYNLIPHQTLLANVELALTISGISKAERRERAKDALCQVGLGDQINKKPNQLSGGQMQRVAIARALVNDPDILLADEPTGALDSDTSIQVMELLKGVAKDRLVVMVTHNPELAQEYATRIVRLKDGRIISDSAPFVIAAGALPESIHKNMGKASMSLLTALSLSFNNLLTKKARTLLTAFAGSIGIIGIALILSLSTGVNQYIKDIEEETLSGYPLQITSTGFDLTSLISGGSTMLNSGGDEEDVEDRINVISTITTMFSKMDANDLESLKDYLESGESGIEQYVNAIEYIYDVTPQIYYLYDDGDVRQVNPDSSFSAMGIGSSTSSSSIMSSMMSTDVFYQLPETTSLYEEQYEVLAGHWPENYNEVVLVLTSRGMSDFMLYTMGLRDSEELDDMVARFVDGEDVEVPEDIGTYTYDDVLGITFKLVSAADYYEYDEQYGVWKDKTDNTEYIKKLVAAGEDITIVGVVQPKDGASISILSTGLYYPASLVYHVAELAADSEIVQAQLADPDTNVLTGDPFGDDSDDSGFDMSSMLSIDEDALSDAFNIDTSSLSNAFSGSFDMSSAFSMDSIDMSALSGSIDLSDISITIPDMPDMDFSDLLSGISFDTSNVDLTEIASELLSGYLSYVGDSTSTDYANIAKYFALYLQTDSAKSIITSTVIEAMADSNSVTVSTDQISSLASSMIASYMSYIVSSGGDATSTSDYLSYLTSYLGTSEAQNIMQSWIADNIEISETSIGTDTLSQLAKSLMSGYQEYASEMGYPDPSDIASTFTEYLSTDEASTILTTAVMSMIDTSALESQISSVLQSYMSTIFAAYGEALAETLEAQISVAMTEIMTQMMSQMASAIETMMTSMVSEIGEALSSAFDIDADAFMEAFQFDMDSDDLTELIVSMSMSASATYSSNLESFGYTDFITPSEIDIYPIDFECKEHVVDILDSYNDRMEATGQDDKVITYTDTVGTLMSSVTDIIDMISYVLIAFVGISLVVSSIMIGVITYISVLERQKEIGILRAIGASKGNISQVFNAETGIIGFCAGALGIGLAMFLTIPGNYIIHTIAGNTRVNMVLLPQYGVALIVLSIILTLIGGLIPSSKAAKSDPVAALRSE